MLRVLLVLLLNFIHVLLSTKMCFVAVTVLGVDAADAEGTYCICL